MILVDKAHWWKPAAYGRGSTTRCIVVLSKTLLPYFSQGWHGAQGWWSQLWDEHAWWRSAHLAIPPGGKGGCGGNNLRGEQPAWIWPWLRQHGAGRYGKSSHFTPSEDCPMSFFIKLLGDGCFSKYSVMHKYYKAHPTNSCHKYWVTTYERFLIHLVNKALNFLTLQDNTPHGRVWELFWQTLLEDIYFFA